MKKLFSAVVGVMLALSGILPSVPVAHAAESAITSVTYTGPSTATLGTAFTLSASFTGAAASTCSAYMLYPAGGGIAPITLTISGSIASASYTFPGAYPTGTYQIEIQCEDMLGVTRHSPLGTITVSASSGSAVTSVSAPLPATATIGTPVTFSSTFTGPATLCLIEIMGPSGVWNSWVDMTIAGTTASYTYTFSSSYAPGIYPADIKCRDAAGTYRYSATTNVTVSAATSAVTSVSAPLPATATIGTPVTFTSTFAGPATLCLIEIMGPSGVWNSYTDMTRVGTTASYTYTFNSSYAPGSYPVDARCRDAAGLYRNSATTNVTVSAAPAGDATTPVVATPTPSSAVVGAGVTISATYSDAVGVTSCDLYEGGFMIGSMSLSGTTAGTASRFHTFEFAGSNTIEVRCRDAAGNIGTASRAVSVGSGASAVTSVAYVGPANVTIGSNTTFSATYTGSATYCNLNYFLGGSPTGGESVPMGLSGGTASVTYVPSASHFSAGTYQASVTCSDSLGNNRESALATVVFSTTPAPDTALPTLSNLTPSTATVGTSPSIIATYADAVGVTACDLYVNGSLIGAMTRSGTVSGTATRSYTFTTAGAYAVEARCRDAAGNIGTRSQTVTVSVTAPSDTINPVVTSIAPVSAVAGSSYSVTAVYSDAVGVTACELYVGGSLIGNMVIGASNGGTASRSYTYPSSGSIATEVRCRDAAGNSGNGVTTVSVAAASVPVPSVTDTAPPTVGPISPNTAMREATQTYSVSFADASYITNCTLYVQQGTRYAPYVMSRTGASVGYASFQYTYYASVTPGTYNMYATCTDEHGRVGTGPTTGITVGTVPVAPVTPPGGSYFRQLVKLRCPEGYLDANHACKAVYYVSSDGKRHAFPNERAYFTWYADFNNVYELDSLSTFSLGANVTYRPGIRLVKFTTLDRVYAVGRNGLLRWITSETAARALYGSQWNRQIDDISDAFYANYRFGTDINTTSDFSPSSEAAAVTSVDTNF